MEADTLFEQHSIKEIQDIEKKLRCDIERKKEELRQMVGERYRDLMDAADTITEMKQTAENVALRINAMESNCTLLEKSSLTFGIIKTVKQKVALSKKKNENLYSIAAVVKILMQAPERIWSHIEKEDYLSAMLLYVLARHSHAFLVLNPQSIELGALAHFPIVTKQWTSIRHFQSMLLQKSKEVLFHEKLYAEEAVGPLCCLLFLSDVSEKNLLHEVLKCRKDVILRIFQPEKSAKVQICELVDCLQNTMKMIHELFDSNISSFDDLKTNLLQETVNKITSIKASGPVSLLDTNSATLQYLSKDISDYRPSLKSAFTGIETGYLQSIFDEWIVQLNSELQTRLSELLNYVNSVKGLALIKEAVMEKLQKVQHWDTMCNHLLGHDFTIWGFMLHENFMERIMVIINKSIQLSSEECNLTVNNIFTEIKDADSFDNVSSYIWTESSSDLATNLGWKTHHHRQLWEGGSLGIKAHAFTPKIMKICSDLDKQLKCLLDDISSFSPTDKKEKQLQKWEPNPPKNSDKDDMEAAVDMKFIRTHLNNVSQKHFFILVKSFSNFLHSFEHCDKNATVEDYARISFMGHVCHSLTKLCPHLMQCFLEEDDNTSKLHTTSKNKDDQQWQKLKTYLLEQSDYAFRIWSKHKIAELSNKFDEEFRVCSGTCLLNLLLQWDKVEIEEESEEGQSVKSVVRIPQQVSVPLHNCLFLLCLEMSKIGGHALSSKIRTEVQEQLYHHLIAVYERKVTIEWPEDIFNSHLAQTQSLQLFFDVHFLMGLMGTIGKTEDESSQKAKDILSKLSASIDPFDMDVFSSHIQTSLRHAIQTSLLLFGLIVPHDHASHLSNMKMTISPSQLEHSLMLMPSNSSRLPLLPFASRSTVTLSTLQDSMRSISSSLEASPLKTSRSHSSSSNLNSQAEANLLKSSSFYDRVSAMSSSWFGNT